MQFHSTTPLQRKRAFAHRVPLAKRFWQKVTKGDSCWIWVGAKNHAGYGKLGEGPKDGRTLAAHRVSWELNVGPIPMGLCVLHHCDTPPCVNPAHLFLGTLSANSRDMVAKRRNPVLIDPSRHARGNRYPQAKLDPESVQQIRAEYAQGNITQKALALRFGVSESLIWPIVNLRIWRHV